MTAKHCAHCSVELAKAMRCSQCKTVCYCSRECQKQHWGSHKSQCKALALALLATESPFAEAAVVQTRGAAGWAHFVIDGKDFLAVANFFTSGPGRQPSMETDSSIFLVRATEDRKLQLTEVQSFRTVGAHGVVHFECSGHHYLSVPNYYGGDTLVLRWDRAASRFAELQRIKSEGGGGVDAFKLDDGRCMLAIAEFNVGIAALYILQDGRFEPFQRIAAPGVGSIATLRVPADDGGEALLLLASSYVTRQTGWRTRSPIFALNAQGSAFEAHDAVATIGAHDVEVLSAGGRHFAFYSNDKDERTTLQASELFEWVGTFPSGRFESKQKVETDGAHAAALFASADGKSHFLAVANLGDRKSGKYRRDSVVYALDVESRGGDMLTAVQKLPTLGATDFSAFEMGGVTYLAHEQDDWLGGDVRSVIWGLRDGWGKKWREQSSDGKRAIATTPKESCSEELD